MNDTKVLIEKIKEGIQEKKVKNIIISDGLCRCTGTRLFTGDKRFL